MSPYDVSADDDPLDVAAVGKDDALIESLRRSLSPEAAVVWDDDDDEVDPAFALLRVLQRDVSADLPVAAGLLPVGVTALVPRQRRFGRTATIAAVTAGVLSIGGVAAAAGGSPLTEVRHVVSSVVNAITPDHPVGPAVTKPRHSDKPSPKPGRPADAGRSSATAQIAAELDKAARLLADGDQSAATEQLDAASRTLPLVLDAATRDAFAARITALRARLASPQPDATHNGVGAGDDAKGHGGTNGDSTKGDGSKSDGSKSDGSTGDSSKSDRSTGDSSRSDGKKDSSPSDSSRGDVSKSDTSKSDTSSGDSSKSDSSKSGSGTSGSSSDGARSSEHSKPEPGRTPHVQKPSTPGADATEQHGGQAPDPVKPADDSPNGQ